MEDISSDVSTAGGSACVSKSLLALCPRVTIVSFNNDTIIQVQLPQQNAEKSALIFLLNKTSQMPTRLQRFKKAMMATLNVPVVYSRQETF